jgi:hypothetical protein
MLAAGPRLKPAPSIRHVFSRFNLYAVHTPYCHTAEACAQSLRFLFYSSHHSVVSGHQKSVPSLELAGDLLLGQSVFLSHFNIIDIFPFLQSECIGLFFFEEW